MGRDLQSRQMKKLWIYFNPRAPCGARRYCGCDPCGADDFNPRAPCGARRHTRPLIIFPSAISIHAPRVGRDDVSCRRRKPQLLFQSTRPVWGATSTKTSDGGTTYISIHAPRVGRDVMLPFFAPSVILISIHAPRVGRDSKFDDFTPSNLHKRYKRVLARPKNTREKGKIKQKLAYIHAFSAFLGCEGSGTFCALVLRTQYR